MHVYTCLRYAYIYIRAYPSGLRSDRRGQHIALPADFPVCIMSISRLCTEAAAGEVHAQIISSCAVLHAHSKDAAITIFLEDGPPQNHFLCLLVLFFPLGGYP